MADKPPVKSAIGKVGMKDSDTVEEIITLLAGMILLGAIATALLNYINSLGLGAYEGPLSNLVNYFFAHIWPVWKVVAVFVSIAASVGIAYNLKQLNALEAEERLIFDPPHVAHVSGAEPIVSERKNERWEKILKLTNSENESDWRLAILEADVMLEELLRTLGYPGDSVGEMLKAVDKDTFFTLDDAWEAHKVRNDVAHGGAEFKINERETKRVIALFEKVFKEVELI